MGLWMYSCILIVIMIILVLMVTLHFNVQDHVIPCVSCE